MNSNNEEINKNIPKNVLTQIQFYQKKAFKSKLTVGLISLAGLILGIALLVSYLLVDEIKQSIALNVVFILFMAFGFFGFLVCGILFPIYCVKNYVIVKDYNNKIIWVYASSYYISIHVDEQIVAKDTTKSFSKAKLECMYEGLDIKVEGKTIKVNGKEI